MSLSIKQDPPPPVKNQQMEDSLFSKTVGPETATIIILWTAADKLLIMP